ncbi:MAG: trypsin-like peptidase domain-containing protein [Anaerolineae bacterium]|nr:trypsin-like peptidase domain-containing protein [Anaerolineae bacterium]
MSLTRRLSSLIWTPLRRPVALLALIVLLAALFACGVPSTNTASDQPIAGVDVGTQGTVSRALAPTATAVSADIVASAQAAQTVFTNLYERISPSVVNIETLRRTARVDDQLTGSGFIYDTQGHIITNAHVVYDAREVWVTFNDGYVTAGEIVGVDNFSDLAVLKVNVDSNRSLAVTLGDSSMLKVGQWVATIGNPFGLLSSMTMGIISATGRTLDSSQMIDPTTATRFSNPSIIQIDAQINPGNSGGPLLDITGNVIGVNTAIRSETGSFQGIGFAVPVNTVKKIVPQIIANGRASYAWLGIDSSSVFTVASVAADLKLPVDYGVLVTSVAAGSPAEEAGLRGGAQTASIRGNVLTTGGDLIIAINNQRMRDFEALLTFLLDNTSPGDTITLTVIRENATFDVQVTLRERPQ